MRINACRRTGAKGAAMNEVMFYGPAAILTEHMSLVPELEHYVLEASKMHAHSEL